MLVSGVLLFIYFFSLSRTVYITSHLNKHFVYLSVEKIAISPRMRLLFYLIPFHLSSSLKRIDWFLFIFTVTKPLYVMMLRSSLIFHEILDNNHNILVTLASMKIKQRTIHNLFNYNIHGSLVFYFIATKYHTLLQLFACHYLMNIEVAFIFDSVGLIFVSNRNTLKL